MGLDGALKVFTPNGWTAGAHLVGDQFVRAWNTRELKSLQTHTFGTVAARLTTLLWWLLQLDPGNEIGHLVVLRGQHGQRLGDVFCDPRGVLSEGGPNARPLRITF